MIILQSLMNLSLMIAFFTVMGLGVSNYKTAKHDLALVPIFGFAAVVSLSYIISANFKISGNAGVTYAIILLCSSLLLRIRSFAGLFQYTAKNGELRQFWIMIAIPVCTLLFPAIFAGFKHFYAYVNYDFFYNSQDAWFLQTHHVAQFNITNEFITPLNWSANFAGRIAAPLLASFFPKWINWDALQFNSLLLNTLVLLFTLAMSSFCKEFFGLRKKALMIAVFFSIMSAGYVQGYSYYVLGQISVIPIFVVYCIYLKRFFDDVAENNSANINKNAIILGLLLNALFIMYAIVSMFAACITVVSYFICFRKQAKDHLFSALFKSILIAVLVFCAARILIAADTLNVLKSWISLSSRVAVGRHGDVFLVFSEYLTETFLSLFFGLANYVSTNSIISLITPSGIIRIGLLSVMGIGALVSTLFVIKNYASSDNSKSARAIIIALFGITFTVACYFYYSWSAYGIFKLQTWFMPVLIPLYVYYLNKTSMEKTHIALKASCGIILALNLVTGIKYLSDFSAIDTNQHFVNVHGINGNNDLDDIAEKAKSSGYSGVSLFLTNGAETAWLANSLRTLTFDKVSHNVQVLNEKDFIESVPASQLNQNWTFSGPIITTNPALDRSDITTPPVGGSILYKNKGYMILDPHNLETLVYIGSGAYPVEYFPTKSTAFPSKFRWVEKGVEIMIYSNKDKTANLNIEITPGYVDNKNLARNMLIKTDSNEYKFAVNTKTTLTVPNLKLHQGLNRITVESPDNVARLVRKGSFMRTLISLDPRLTNFAISNVVLN